MSVPILPQQHLAAPASGKSVSSRAAVLKCSVALLVLWSVAAWIRFSGLPRSQLAPNLEFISSEGMFPDYGVVAHVDESNETLLVVNFTKPETLEAQQVVDTGVARSKHADRAAVIVEDRPLPNLVPVILHFHTVLGPEWPIILYTSNETGSALKESVPFSRAMASNDVEVRYLPPETKFTSHASVSTFLTSTFLWADLAPYSKVLLFQADSILCAAAPGHVDDFLRYDLVGAPIDSRWGEGYNGGLSLRSRDAVLAVIDRWNFTADSTAPGATRETMFEDQWFYKRMRELADDAEYAAKEFGLAAAVELPDAETASRFAVETIYAEKPLGFHQPSRWQKERMQEIAAYCPEVGMISKTSFFDD